MTTADKCLTFAFLVLVASILLGTYDLGAPGTAAELRRVAASGCLLLALVFLITGVVLS